ncbi:MAG TPA: Ppx/GppA phosphatase family protein [Deinococcales bacterium]|nr:Ppx/GppA phosphatase family protein [Deinococcales bacterium]
MQRVGIVDLGSNTSRLVVYAFSPGEWFRLEDEIREPVRLGEGLAETGRLSSGGIERGLAALRLYSDFAAATGLKDVTVIATSAVRDAENQEGFLEAAAPLGLPVEVLSGPEEAAHGVLAVANSLNFRDCWVMDLGGGSAQLSRMENREYAGGTAHPLGGVRLTEGFLRSDPPKNGEVEALERHALQSFRPELERMKADRLPLVAMGGTIRNLARAVQKAQGFPMDLLHGYFLEREALEALIERLLSSSTKQRAAIPGINADRADVILAGALVYRAVLRGAGLNGLTVSGQGVREGAFYRRFLPAPHLVPEVRAFGVWNLFRRYEQPTGHTERVRDLARALFEGTASLHGLGPLDARTLDDAALLHDIGTAIGYHDHHKHGAYLVAAASLPGVPLRDHALLTLLVQYHRKGEPKPGVFKPLVTADDAPMVARLAACLRLAEYLERSRAGRVKGLEVKVQPRAVRVTLLADEEPWVELWEARKQAPFFQRAFGRPLVLETRVG